MILLLLALQAADDVRFFEERIRPLLIERCYECHGAKKPRGGLRLDTREATLKGGHSGPAIIPGDPEKSLLLRAVRYADPELQMPPKDRLPPEAVADLEAWIRRGAPDPRVDAGPVKTDKPLWSLQPLSAPEPPPVKDVAWARTPIDRFILAKLEAAGLRPSPEAELRTLLRRAVVDLHGIPPGADELDALAALGYEKAVEQLLASPRYGERWGRHWLDAVHFGETHGYDKDKKRPNAWPYRDYVIRALNADTSFSRFAQEQIAGDVLLPDDPEALVATGFVAAGPWDFVGHTELPETKTDGLIARYNDRDDMVSTTVSTFLSLTVHCARCHDHKFDPIPQVEYYALQAVFAGVDRGDRPFDVDPEVRARREIRPSNGWHSAVSTTPDAEKWVEVDLGAETDLDEIRLVPARPTDFADTPGFGFPPRYRVDLDGRPLAGRDAGKAGETVAIRARRGRVIRVTALRLRERSGDYVFALAELVAVAGGRNAALGAEVRSLDSIEAGRWGRAKLVDGYGSRGPVADPALPPPSLVYAPVPRRPRTVHVLGRGDVRKPLRPAEPGGLSCVPGPDARFEGEPRAALARWITDPRNALFRRSIVNRVWHHHFGRGLVDTPNDFGRMGGTPSHPELLDWLAGWFAANGESLKALHRLILASAVWRQSAAHDPAAAAVDADNRLLWRMTRRRLDAESFRDGVLAASGRLDPRMGGPSDEHFRFKDDHSPVYDYAAFDPDGPAGRRRSVYRLVVRSVPDPLFDALDAADPSILTPARTTTLTALQALAALNDRFVLVHCRHLAGRVRGEADPTAAACRLVWGRSPTPGEHAALSSYAGRHGLENLARVLFNSNEFVFVE